MREIKVKTNSLIHHKVLHIINLFTDQVQVSSFSSLGHDLVAGVGDFSVQMFIFNYPLQVMSTTHAV